MSRAIITIYRAHSSRLRTNNIAAARKIISAYARDIPCIHMHDTLEHVQEPWQIQRFAFATPFEF